MIKKILIIDDSPISRKIIKKCLPTDMNLELYEAGDGKEGMDQFARVKPDLVFLDLTMPVMDGREFLKEVKKESINTIVIVCTADVQTKSLDEVMELGALMVLKKPPSKESVQEAMLRAEERFKTLGDS